ncbi:hypothetical protein AWB81_04048 [Caballeronia arationis]|jgi:hypothetical protein|uniref:Uncharacterized protein n=1 Tax=Caballeronia arationis TaxID=1777142 RepID=A0A7Z7I7H4_9BURK|nr:hypothetical protein AWB81_04048 [Caballeronia arationis]SOE80715.1 hypothetical protein SAMN05446927_3958 [Caballeronia arationis]
MQFDPGLLLPAFMPIRSTRSKQALDIPHARGHAPTIRHSRETSDGGVKIR